MKLTRTSAGAQVLTLDEVKKHVEVEGTTAHDAQLTRLIQQATDFVEGPTGKLLALNEQTWEMRLDRFCPYIQIPIWPIISVDQIQYVDLDGATQTLDAAVWEADVYDNPAMIRARSERSFPGTKWQFNAVTITFTAGWPADPGVPEDLKGALLLLIGHWFDNREDSIVGTIVSKTPKGFDSIIEKYAPRAIA